MQEAFHLFLKLHGFGIQRIFTANVAWYYTSHRLKIASHPANSISHAMPKWTIRPPQMLPVL